MAEIIAEEHVQCTAADAGALLERAIGVLAGGPSLPLRIPLDAGTVRTGAALEQTVRFTVGRVKDASGLNDLVAITFEPEGGLVPLPVMHATLAVDPDVDGETSVLSLTGSYDPPGSLLGKAFDESVGFWIARATAHDLARRLARTIEAIRR
jgi:hypothetical protein